MLPHRAETISNVSNPLAPLYMKLGDVNLTNALSLSNAPAADKEKHFDSHPGHAADPDLQLPAYRNRQDSSGDVWSYSARVWSSAPYTTGSEFVDGITIFVFLLWPVLGLLIKFIVYDAISGFDQADKLAFPPWS